MSLPDQNQSSSSSSTYSAPYTPTHADPSVITAGLGAFGGVGAKAGADYSTKFNSLVGGSGGLGRLPALAKRSLVGGA